MTTDSACGFGFGIEGSPVSGMSPICATFHRSCQSCKITRTAEPRTNLPEPAEHAQTAKPAPRSGRRKASLRDQNPGSEKKRGSGSGKKARIEPPCVSHGIAPISPASRAAPGGCVPGVFDERPNLPKPKPPAPQSPCLQPRRSFPRAPEPCRGRASQTAVAQHFLTYGLKIRGTILAA